MLLKNMFKMLFGTSFRTEDTSVEYCQWQQTSKCEADFPN